MRAKGVGITTTSAMLSLMMLVAQPVAATPTVVDFDQFTGMEWENPAPVPVSAQLHDQLLSTLGVRFTSGGPFVTVVDMGDDHAVSAPNAIAGSTPDGMLTYDRLHPVVISFWMPGDPSVMAVTDSVSVRGDLWGGGRAITLNAFDVSGNLIGASTTSDTGGAILQISAAGIHSVQFLGTDNDGGVAIDDLTFDPLEPAVPAPAAVMLVVCGLGVVRALGRRCPI